MSDNHNTIKKVAKLLNEGNGNYMPWVKEVAANFRAAGYARTVSSFLEGKSKGIRYKEPEPLAEDYIFTEDAAAPWTPAQKNSMRMAAYKSYGERIQDIKDEKPKELDTKSPNLFQRIISSLRMQQPRGPQRRRTP